MTPYTLEFLVPLVVVLPLIGAGLTVVAGSHVRIQRAISGTILAGVVCVSAGLLWASDTQRTLVVRAGGWRGTMGITLVVDRLSALMLLISTVITFGVMAYASGQGNLSDDAQGEGDAPLPIFHPTLLVLSAGVSTTFISGDLFHLYVGFEMLLFASFVLLTLDGTSERVRAGINYVITNLLSSVIFLLAIGLVYAATGTVNLAQLSGRLPTLPPNTSLMLQLFLLLAFAIKAALFPMSSWLPDSYPTAPAPATAVFAGLLTKVGVYAILRTQTLLFPQRPLTDLFMWAALLTMLVGILGAVAQDDIKRMLSFTLVSHIGFMIFGVALATPAGLSAAIFYVAHHITVQTTLFLATGMVELRGGSTSLARLGGLAAAAPGLSLLFFVPAMNLAGVPPLSGFLGKAGLLEAGAQVGSPMAYALLAGSVVTSLLTLYAVSRVWSRAFWRSPAEDPGPPRKLGLGVIVPTAGLVLFGLGLTVFAGPLFAITDRAALNIADPSQYVQAVLGGKR